MQAAFLSESDVSRSFNTAASLRVPLSEDVRATSERAFADRGAVVEGVARGRAFLGGLGCTRANQRPRAPVDWLWASAVLFFQSCRRLPAAPVGSLASSAPSATSRAIRRTRSTESSSLTSSEAPSSANLLGVLLEHVVHGRGARRRGPAIGVAGAAAASADRPSHRAAWPPAQRKVWRRDSRARMRQPGARQ